MLRGDRAFKKSMLGFVPLSGTDHPLWPKDYMWRIIFYVEILDANSFMDIVGSGRTYR